MKGAVYHVFLTLIWFFLSQSRSIGSLIIGFSIGYGILFLFRNPLEVTSYVMRFGAFFTFSYRFLLAFISSNLTVAKQVVFTPVGQLKPGFIEYPVSDLSSLEVILLSQCISLTPGTTSIEYQTAKGILLVHCLDLETPQEVIEDISTSLRDPLLKVLRPWQS